ncbi:MAG: NAD-dependent epimerase/dehydratase family protein [Solirubrobacteraceae bacterium]
MPTASRSLRRSRTVRWSLPGLVLATVAALAFAAAAGSHARSASTSRVTVMTRNLFLGTNLLPLGTDRFVHFSSVTVFGLEFPDGVDERYPVRSTFIPYPDSKIASEQVVLQAHVEGRVPRVEEGLARTIEWLRAEGYATA